MQKIIESFAIITGNSLGFNALMAIIAFGVLLSVTGNSLGFNALMTIIALGVLLISMAHQKSGKSDWWLLAFYGVLIAAVGGAFIGGIFAVFAVSIVSVFIFIIFITALTTVNTVFALSVSISATVISAFFLDAIGIIPLNQQVGFAIVIAYVIVVSYLLAKKAKRLGWINVVPQSSEMPTV